MHHNYLLVLSREYGNIFPIQSQYSIIPLFLTKNPSVNDNEGIQINLEFKQVEETGDDDDDDGAQMELYWKKLTKRGDERTDRNTLSKEKPSTLNPET